MSRDGLSIFEKIELKIRGKFDALNTGAFQDAYTGEWYPASPKNNTRYIDYIVQEGTAIPKPETIEGNSVQKTAKKPFVASTFIQTEINGFSDIRNDILTEMVIKYKNPKGAYRKNTFINIWTEYEKAIEECSNNISSLSEKYEGTKKMLLDECNARKGSHDAKHIDVLYKRKLSGYAVEFVKDIVSEKSRLKMACVEMKCICESMKSMIDSEFTHCLSRISFYYDCAQRYDTRLLVKLPNKDEIIKCFNISLFENISEIEGKIDTCLNAAEKCCQTALKNI